MNKAHFVVSLLTLLVALAILSLNVYTFRNAAPTTPVEEVVVVAEVTPEVSETPAVEPTASVSASPSKKATSTPVPSSDTLE